jgi:hypothetical protein
MDLGVLGVTSGRLYNGTVSGAVMLCRCTRGVTDHGGGIVTGIGR